MGKRNKVTTRDIADYTGLSQSTVSMVLSGRAGVSFTEDTERTVKEAAKKLGYKKPVKKSKSLEGSLADTILVLAPLLTNSYYTSIIHAINEQAAVHNYRVMTQVTFRNADQESACLTLARTSRLAGIIILYPISRIADANAIFKTTPVVLIGEKPDQVRFDCVELDSRKPAYLMADHLLALGHRRFAFISTPIKKHEISRVRRLEGLRLACADHGLREDCVEVWQPSPQAYRRYAYQSAEYRTGYEMTQKVLKEGSRVTALIGQNDMTAYGILAALREGGFRIPRDYSVGGFDDATFSSMPQISLTTVDHATLQKGKDAVDLIAARKQALSPGTGRQDTEREAGDPGGLAGPKRSTRIEYEPRLVVRNSTGPAAVHMAEI